MRKIKKIAVVLAMVAMLAVLAACGAASITRPIAEEGKDMVAVEGTCSISREGDVLKVSVSTNLMDGAAMKVTIDSYNGDQLAAKYYTKAGDNFYVEFDIDPEWSGIVYGTMTCEPHANGDHTEEIYEAYGDNFQNIEGEDVLYNLTEGNYLVLQSEGLEL